MFSGSPQERQLRVARKLLSVKIGVANRNVPLKMIDAVFECKQMAVRHFSFELHLRREPVGLALFNEGMQGVGRAGDGRQVAALPGFKGGRNSQHQLGGRVEGEKNFGFNVVCRNSGKSVKPSLSTSKASCVLWLARKVTPALSLRVE